MCTEDIPRQERAAESYMRQAKILDQKILTYWTKWKNSKNELLALCNKAVSECPSLNDFVDKMQLQSKLRQVEARDELRQKLLHLENDEINAFTNYMSDMPNMLRNLYLTLKGYDKVPPSLAAEYMEIMRKAKAGKAISWVDEDEDRATADIQFKYISSLDLENYVTNPENSMVMINIKGDSDISFNSVGTDEVTDEESKEVENISTMKRKGTPINKASDTIVIEDSFVDSSIDSTRTVTPAKKVKTEFINNIATDIENFANGCIDPLNLNSTFVLAGKMEDKLSTKMEPVKRGLVDKTNTMPRHITFNDRAKIVKPVVGKALPFRRPPASAPLRPAFGSSAPREAQRTVQDQSANRPKSAYTQKSVGYKAVRVRERVASQAHPYARSTPSTRR